MKIIRKPWGYEKILIRTDNYMIKILHLKPKHRLSKQYHIKKEETLIYPNFKIKHIKPKQIHRIENKSNKELNIIEVSTPHLKDVVRISDDYGRVK